MMVNGILWWKGSYKISLFVKRNLYDILLFVLIYRKKNLNVNFYLWFILMLVYFLKLSLIFIVLVDYCCVIIRLYFLI